MNEPKDIIFNKTTMILAQVAEKEDQVMKDAVVRYAQDKSHELDVDIQVLFLSKTIADEIIELGIQAYVEKQKEEKS